MSLTILNVSNLSKTFGGVVATDHLNLEIKHGELHAIIGPNGAGKTTLIAQLSGETLPDSGEIIFREENITALPPFKRSRLGIARSFQITSLMLEMDVIDNITLAILARDNHSYKFWKPAREDTDLQKAALNALKEIGLEERAFEKVGNLSHGEHRQLEIAMALATQPHLLLLDEPTASLDPSPAPGPMFPITNGNIAIIVLSDVIIIGLNLKLHASFTDFSISLPLVLN